VVAPLVWASTLTLAAGQAAMLAVGLAAFILYLRLAGFTPVTAQKS
jgi:hypothetical protein